MHERYEVSVVHDASAALRSAAANLPLAGEMLHAWMVPASPWKIDADMSVMGFAEFLSQFSAVADG